jgi:hypothetical protein
MLILFFYLSAGFRSTIARYPHDKFGIAVFSNDELYGNIICDIVMYRITDHLLELEPIDWNARYEGLKFKSPEVLNVFLYDICFMFDRQKTSIRELYDDFLQRHRPTNPSPPSLPRPGDLAGKYRDDAYGEIELCFIPPSSDLVQGASMPSDSCKELIKSAPIILPGVIDEEDKDVMTFLVHWNGVFASHMRLRHHDQDVFNITLFNSVVSLLSFIRYLKDLDSCLTRCSSAHNQQSNSSLLGEPRPMDE